MKPTVILLHGLGRTWRSMAGLRRRLEEAGYPTWARSYPSRKMPIDELAEHVAARVREEVPEGPVVGVTHSLGGILVRHMADLLPWSAVVMLAPPNRGSRVAARLRARAWFRWTFGPAGQGVADPSGWPPPPEPFAVIAGTRGPSLGNPSSWLTAPLGVFEAGVLHDGTVSVEETRLEGMAAFATVPASHTWIMRHPRAQELVLSFLAERRFPPEADPPDAGPTSFARR